MKFQLASELQPQGDQPKAIEGLAEGIELNKRLQVLLGISKTGLGKIFIMANVIQKVQKPTLIFAHNQSLAAPL